MAETARAVGDIADLVRSKNAGPFWLTLDVFFPDAAAYRQVEASGVLTATRIGELYRVDPATVQLFHLPSINVVKASFPRPTVQGSFSDTDIHAGQHHIPLAQLPVPVHGDGQRSS